MCRRQGKESWHLGSVVESSHCEDSDPVQIRVPAAPGTAVQHGPNLGILNLHGRPEEAAVPGIRLPQLWPLWPHGE